MSIKALLKITRAMLEAAGQAKPPLKKVKRKKKKRQGGQQTGGRRIQDEIKRDAPTPAEFKAGASDKINRQRIMQKWHEDDQWHFKTHHSTKGIGNRRRGERRK